MTRSLEIGGFVLSSLVIALATAACRSDAAQSGGSTEPAVPAVPAAPTTSTTVSIRGRVAWEGVIPERRVIDLSAIPECARERTEPLLSDEIVVHPDRSVESVLLFVDAAVEAGHAAPPAHARIESRGCQFVPHVVAIEAGQSIDFVQTSPTLVNIHLVGSANAEQNFAMNGRGRRSVLFPEVEPGFIRLKSEVHPWMSAWIAVLPHPWFAVTGPDGRYAIEGIPPGARRLVLRHPRLGEQTVDLVLGAGADVVRDFVLSAKPTPR